MKFTCQLSRIFLFISFLPGNSHFTRKSKIHENFISQIADEGYLFLVYVIPSHLATIQIPPAHFKIILIGFHLYLNIN